MAHKSRSKRKAPVPPALVKEPATVPRLGGRGSREGKVRKEFWLSPALLREAQAHLGASTERETVEMALDLVAFRKELAGGARALRKLELHRLE